MGIFQHYSNKSETWIPVVIGYAKREMPIFRALAKILPVSTEGKILFSSRVIESKRNGPSISLGIDNRASVPIRTDMKGCRIAHKIGVTVVNSHGFLFSLILYIGYQSLTKM